VVLPFLVIMKSEDNFRNPNDDGAMAALSLDEFLRPLAIDSRMVLELSRELETTFRHLSAESPDQFLPTPISESMLRPAGRGHGR
jgi:hypothetical protein